MGIQTAYPWPRRNGCAKVPDLVIESDSPRVDLNVAGGFED